MLRFRAVSPQADSEAPQAPDLQLRLPLPGLLERPPALQAIPRKDRVFANRNLHLAEIEWIGFDMDYTLAIYVQSEMDALSVRLTVDRLIARGYPESLRSLSFDTNFPIRGLLDKERGNILKLDRHKQVAKGYHGLKLLDKNTIDSLYHEQKLRYQSSRYHWIDTLFAMCEVTSYAAIVTALDEQGVEFDPDKLFADVRTSIDEAHADGTVYRAVTSDLTRYLDRDPLLPSALHRLRSAGKKLFLLTNSPYHYTNTVMSHLLASDTRRYPGWQNYFDVIICAAKKPRWFGEGTPFMERIEFPEFGGQDGPKLGSELRKVQGSLERGRIYEGGSLSEFENRLALFGRKVLYVGDHIYGDILRSKKESTWRTALVIQELDQELTALKATADLRVRRRQLYEARPLLEDELRYYQRVQKELYKKPDEDPEVRRSRAAAKVELDRIRHHLVELETEYAEVNTVHDEAFHRYFGPLLKEMNGLSVFGQQVETYADIYMRRVSCLGGYPPTQFFRSPHDLLPHEI
jgi:5'-nucleotidase